ncbi:hypothetical protein G3M54_01365 [Bacillus megaterium NBRC 15308 = ATCC 14581]|nr:hypothetical protein [Priestia megaterium NBRC 15308 = ATCC 14581]
MLIALKLKYGSPEGNSVFAEVMEFMRDVAYATSIDLAIEKELSHSSIMKVICNHNLLKTCPFTLKKALRSLVLETLQS